MNRIILCGIVLSALAAVALSKMCTPPQWHSDRFSSLSNSVMGKTITGMVSVKYFYDAVNQRKAFHYKLIDASYETEGRILLQYYKNGIVKIYTTDAKFDMCEINILKLKFNEFCIPDNSKSQTFYLGLKGKGFPVTRHHYKIGNDEYYVTMTTNQNGDFIPVEKTYNGNIGGATIRHSGTIENLVLSVNESDFAIPPSCYPNQAASILPMEFVQNQDVSSVLKFKERMAFVADLIGF